MWLRGDGSGYLVVGVANEWWVWLRGGGSG